METPGPREVTRLLQAFASGERQVIDRLFPLVYNELRRVAQVQLRRERPDHTLNTTALVHEAYLKLVVSPPDVEWQNRTHFFAIASRAMRQILVNYAKAAFRQKRGGDVDKIRLDDSIQVSEMKAAELIALDEALYRLELINERQSRIVELRYFGGLNIEETAEALGISPATVKRDWIVARAWLFREVSA